MELANLPPLPEFPAEPPISRGGATIRPAVGGDFEAVQALLETSFYRHVHADWYTPSFWQRETGGWVVLKGKQLTGCLLAAADPLPAAWVRYAAFDGQVLSRRQVQSQFHRLLDVVGPELRHTGAAALFWMSHRRWADRWLEQIGFEQLTRVITFRKQDLELPPLPESPPDIEIRSLLPEDIPLLEKLEADTFTPLWRHSRRALNMAWRQALSFDVALVGSRPVGFQHSTKAAQQGAHLARITIDPAWQGRGVGSALISHAFAGYARHGCRHVSLNTQEDNLAAQRLYRKLGFRESSYAWPLWRRSLV